MYEQTNTEFAAHLRIAAKMMDCKDNHGNPIVPGIVRSMRKAADIIDTDEATIAALQSENGSKDKEIVKLKLEKELMRQEWDTLHATLSRVEAERDAANGYLEKIDGMFGTACPNEILAVLEEWRGAQGEA